MFYTERIHTDSKSVKVYGDTYSEAVSIVLENIGQEQVYYGNEAVSVKGETQGMSLRPFEKSPPIHIGNSEKMYIVSISPSTVVALIYNR